MRIIVDVMGGDNAPRETVLGAFAAAQEYKEQNIEYTLVGDEGAIREIATEQGVDLSTFEIVPTTEVITMEDDPVSVMRAKKDSSMSTALRLLSEEKGDAVVSTGNTGALFTGAMLIVRKIKHLQRAGIATILPLQQPVLLMDTGANVEVTAENIVQFACLGSAYMKKIYGLETPRVGLLNNGTEDCKGTQLQVEAYAELSKMKEINFVGNIEGSAVPFDTCDVLVTDGFTGNILVKTIEGMGKLLMGELKNVVYNSGWRGKLAGALIKRPLTDMKHRFDASEVGGAPILGISKPVIKAHGSSNAKAFKNAIRQAIAYASSGIIEEVSTTMATIAEEKKAEMKRAAKAEAEELGASPYPRLK